jgi:hypothetical protein
MEMLELIRYKKDIKAVWDELVRVSRNGTFLFYRDYMDYHSDRFQDASFLVYKKNKVIAAIPGNVKDNTFYSHQGLTYGGILMSRDVTVKEVLEIFTLLNNELKENGISEVIYKPIPLHYHKIPSQEDVYALFLLKAVRTGCNISSVIRYETRPELTESRKSGLRKSNTANICIKESENFRDFWKILEDNLMTSHNAKPVHSLAEMLDLKRLFPQNIKLYIAMLKDVPVGGAVIYISDTVARVQYLSANETGKKTGALDLLFHQLLSEIFRHVLWFDFGTSNDMMGTVLKENLVFQKEGFGGRGIVYETYAYNIK